MSPAWTWDVEQIKKALSEPVKKYKYFITDDKDEFVNRLEIINNGVLLNSKDNLKYLERAVEIKRIRDGEDIFEVLPWLKKDKNNA